MILLGIGDEAGPRLEMQISATKALGWSYIEMRSVEVAGFPKGNFHDIPDKAFDIAVGKLEEAGLKVYCFGSAIANWAKKVTDPFKITQDEVHRCIPRLQRLGTKYVRIMSYRPDDNEDSIPPEVFRRIREVTKMFLDAGIQPIHENCMNYGGMSWKHGVQLLENCPGLKWLFDPCNPVFNADRTQPKPWPCQDPWEYWQHVRDHVVHIHIKDGIYVPAKNDCDYKFPGEGHGRIRDILRDAFSRGFDGGISIEPHIAVVFHDPNVKADDNVIYETYVKYGKATAKLIAEVKQELGQKI